MCFWLRHELEPGLGDGALQREIRGVDLATLFEKPHAAPGCGAINCGSRKVVVRCGCKLFERGRIAGHALKRQTGWIYPKMSRLPRTVSEVIRVFDTVRPRLQRLGRLVASYELMERRRVLHAEVLRAAGSTDLAGVTGALGEMWSTLGDSVRDNPRVAP